MNAEIAKQVEELQRRFKARAEKVPTLIYQAVAQGCLLVVAEAKDNIDRVGAVDTGRLKGSITYRVTQYDSRVVGEVGTNVHYGPHVEFGTKRMKPRPYLYPALATMKPKINPTIAAALRRGLHDV